MRIAISGTHFSGKSTLIANFLNKNPCYHHYQEPYYELAQQEQGASDFSMESMQEQLAMSIQLLEESTDYEDVIFDRCPIDFIAYMMYFAETDHFDLADSEISESFEPVIEAIQTLDLIVFLPLGADCQIEYFDSDTDMRNDVDRHFKQLYRDNTFGLFPDYNEPPIIELSGDQHTMLSKIQLITAT